MQAFDPTPIFEDDRRLQTRKSNEFPVLSPVSREFGEFGDGFARDCLLQRGVTCELDFRGRTHLCRFVSRCGVFEVTETSKLHFKNLAYSTAPTRLVAFLCPSREISA